MDLLGRATYNNGLPAVWSNRQGIAHYCFQGEGSVHYHLRARSKNRGPSLRFASKGGFPASLSKAQGPSMIMLARARFSPNGTPDKDDKETTFIQTQAD